MDDQVKQQSSSYRQGLVLGLTMAEVMLLLIFCLLIAMAAFWQVEREKLVAATTKIEKQEAELRNKQAFIDKLPDNSVLSDKMKDEAKKSGKEPSEFWRELYEAQAVVSSLESDGISREQIKAIVTEYAPLKRQGIDRQTALANADIVGSISGSVAFSRVPTKFPKDFAEAVNKALNEKGSAPANKWPPIISLSEANGYFFAVGSAQLTPEFRRELAETTPKNILDLIRKYEVDVIEVVGHTDEQPLGGIRQSNLDRTLVPVLKGAAAVTNLVPADNVGLGLARAVSVVSVLRQSPELQDYKLIPLSGAQLVNNDETLALAGNPGDIKERRRIEIRLRKSTPHEAASKLEHVVMPQAKPVSKPRPQSVPASPSSTPLNLMPTWITPLSPTSSRAP